MTVGTNNAEGVDLRQPRVSDERVSGRCATLGKGRTHGKNPNGVVLPTDELIRHSQRFVHQFRLGE